MATVTAGTGHGPAVRIQDEARGVVAQSAVMFPLRGYAMAAQFAASLLIARLLDAAGLGQWGLMLAVVQWGYTFFIAWTSAALTRYGREEFLERGGIQVSFTSRMLLLVPSLAFLSLAMLLTGPWIVDAVGISGPVLVMLFVYTLTFTVSETAQYMLPALGRSDLTAAVTAVEKTMVLAILAVHALRGSVSPIAILVSVMVPQVVAASWALFRFRRQAFPPRYDPEHVRRYWQFCKPVLITSPILGIAGWGSLFIIKYYAAFTDVGNFFLAYQFFNALTQVCIVLTTVFSPFTVLLVLRGRKDLTDLLVNRMQWVALAAAVSAALAATVAADLFFLYARHEVAEGLFDAWLLMLPGGIVTFLAAPVSPLFMARDDMRATAVVSSLMTAVNITVGLVLIPDLGMHGAALSTSAGAIANYLGILYLLRKHGIHSRHVLSRLGLAFLPTVVLQSLRSWGTPVLLGTTALFAVASGLLAAWQIHVILRRRREIEQVEASPGT